MLLKSWILASIVLSSSAFAQVSLEEKEKRVQFIENLSEEIPLVNTEVYRRDLVYEKQDLPLDLRARNEANLMAEKISVRISELYQQNLKQTNDPEVAYRLVADTIEKDLDLISPELQDELKQLAYDSLEAARTGSLSQTQSLSKIEQQLLPEIAQRAEYLNHQDGNATIVPSYTPSVNSSKDADRTNYRSSGELISSLISDRDNTRWLSTNGLSITSEKSYSRGLDVSYRLSVEFAGIAIDAGPTITFSRNYSTSVQINAEGLTPILLPDGNFDFFKRDFNGKIVNQGGHPVKRFMSFYCEGVLSFETEYKGEGSFKYAGMGGSVQGTSEYSNKVTVDSRRVLVPEYIDGKSVTLADLSRLCMNGYMNARVSSNLTVRDSLNLLMKNIVSGLRFSHPKTKCLVDKQCGSWFVKTQRPLFANKATYRCAEEPREKFFACVSRGLQGAKCPVYDKKGKLISDGMYELSCDRGLRCVTVQQSGWFTNFSLYSYAVGSCQPINPKTYTRP